MHFTTTKLFGQATELHGPALLRRIQTMDSVRLAEKEKIESSADRKYE